MKNEQPDYTLLETIKSMAEAMKNTEAIGYANRAIEIRDKFSSDKKNNYRIKNVPKEPMAAFKLMVEYTGAVSLLVLKIQHLFIDVNWHEKEIIREINEIELFIKNAETVHVFRAFSYDVESHEKETPSEYEYIRIKEGYYKEQSVNKIELFSSLSHTYARCFMYLPFLKEKLQLLQPKRVTSRLSHGAIGLLRAYLSHSNNKEGEPITYENKDTLAREYGWTSKNSGLPIYQKYLDFAQSINRVSISEKKQTDKQKLKYFEEVLNYLKEQGIYEKSYEQAENEYDKFKALFTKTYPD